MDQRARALVYTERIAKRAESVNLPAVPQFAVGLSIHALWAVSTGLIFEDLQGGPCSDLGLLSEPIRVERGLLAPPARRGQGIVLDDAALRRHEVTGEATDVGAGAPPRTA